MAFAGTNAPPSADPLSATHYQELALAQRRAKPVRKASRVATFNGWVSGILAVLSAPFAPFSVEGFLMTVVLAVVACNELRGRKRLLTFDPAATSLLGWNQIGLLASISTYCLWMIWSALSGTSSLAVELSANPELGDLLGTPGDFDALYGRVALAFYGTVIAVTAIAQGLNAAYYFTRRKYVDECVRETPPWALNLLRTENKS
jgi:hypothetical protein